jgi:FemAB family
MKSPELYNSPKVSLLKDCSAEREQYEADLLERGVPLPLFHRESWTKSFASLESWFLAVLDDSGKCCGGFALDVTQSRALPMHTLLRVQRCGSNTPAMTGAAFSALAKLAERNPRVLRVNIELFSPNFSFRTSAGESLAELGFHHLPEPRSYTQTISVDLLPSEEEIFAQFSAKTRRDIRAISKHPVEVSPITDVMLSERMDAMERFTLQRTGGQLMARDWRAIIAFCSRHPDLARVVGLFQAGSRNEESLLAYACALHHTDHVQYYASASVRDEKVKIPMAYGLIWDLIGWAKRHGAKWFDMGGVTPGKLGDDDDPLGGISDFKRFFSKTLVNVGDEWEWEPHPARAKLAHAIGDVAKWFVGR